MYDISQASYNVAGLVTDSVRRDLEMHSHLKGEVGGAGGGGGGGKILSIVMVSSPIYKL